MKNIVGAVLCLLALNVNGALIDNGTFTTDDVSGLDWLDFSFTDGQAYDSAETLNPGWRHATNSEMVNLFSVLFDGIYDTSAEIGASRTGQVIDPYANQRTDIAVFESLFGITQTTCTNDQCVSIYGVFEDEGGILRISGAWYSQGNHSVITPENLGDYEVFREGNSEVGIYMVRASVVPVPSAVWLFGSGLIGLIGLAKRKKT